MSKALLAAAKMYDDPRFLSKSEIRIYKNKLRRERIIRRQKLALALAAAVVVFVFSFLLSTLILDAQSDEYAPEFKYYKQITVHSGDTLWDIAAENISYDHYSDIASYVAEVSCINNLPENCNILAGESLIIPYYSAEFK
ncbi:MULTISPECIES: LysM peptidoglycan-binding domain-containing protein [unclassified Butyrivibrio]|uniref:LysM peptidoglycan-binding domain-containing protein n=1 Tax=unclassified Butyrivibrio TaxID=2639466 RepID=UPI0003B415C2|nr:MULTISPECIES: LysM peptidoglycan-binding domain-containing protein [unclassified Butyrivibrio]MDC7292345.1 LysM peptidoglycan-binding domain-containing protein [Butyrivibrio sp. DSM 10294]